MGVNNANLAALIGSRICHDLISPIGAITNGLELLDLTGDMQGPEMGLISDSVGNAGARIRFFRIAYGKAGDHAMGAAEVRTLLTDLAQGTRFSYVWDISDARPRAMIRLAFLAIQCCETSLPRGGEIQITCTDGTWSIIGTGTELNVEPDLWSLLSGAEPRTPLTPALVQFGLLPTLGDDTGCVIRVQSDQTRIRVSISQSNTDPD